jgi:erythronate-4-phosphate dehydrogenase
MKIVVDKNIPFIRKVLGKYAEVAYLEGSKICKDDVSDADALIVGTRTKCNASLLKGTNVQFIASATIGYDHLDIGFCRANNIFWTNAEGCNSSSVQQYIVAALFYLAKKFNFKLTNKTIGIVGVGNVGKKIATICKSLSMHVLLNDPPRERFEKSNAFVSLDTIVEQADIITLHVPLNNEGEDKTFHLVDEQFCSRLKPHQMLINSSRGEVVDSNALKTVLKDKRLTACVLDVWENEPNIDTTLLGLTDIGTPHIAGYSADGKANASAMCIQAMSRFFGLGIDTWLPESIPQPDNTLIELDCKNLDQQEVLEKAVFCTYDILLDHCKLRNSPHTFEQQRAKYPLRREFPVYTVRLLNAKDNLQSLVAQFGFQIYKP